MTFHTPKPRTDDIAEAIRKRICLQPHDEQEILLEGALAAEFGVSRTPVRQVLQRLAYEGLVEIRTGVGSVVNPLDPAARELHLAVHSGLLRLVASLADAPIPRDIARHLDFLCAQDVAAMSKDAEATYQLFAELNALLSDLIPDSVIAEAHLVSGWRIVRWHLSDLQNNHEAPVEKLLALCFALQGALGKGRVALFNAASTISASGRN